MSTDHVDKTLLAPSKDGQSLYSLDAITGDLNVHQKNGKPAKKVPNTFANVKSFAVGNQQEVYLGQSDSTVHKVSSDGRRLTAIRTVFPWSIAVLSNGNVVVASPVNGKNLHLYNSQGLLLSSFGDIRPFDASQAQNDFLNQGRVVVGRGDEIYYVSTFAPQPLTKEFISRRGVCSLGVTIITSATVDPETGHLWLGMNGLSTQGTVYEYDRTGTKLREFALLVESNNKRKNVTHVKDIAVSGDSLSILTWGGTYGFTLSEVLIADAWKVPTKTSKTIKPTWDVFLRVQ